MTPTISGSTGNPNRRMPNPMIPSPSSRIRSNGDPFTAYAPMAAKNRMPA